MNNDLISRSALTERIVDLLVFEWGYEGIEESVRRIFSEIPAVDAGPKWFSVKDRLPEVWKDVLTHRAGGHLSIEFKCSGDGWSFDNEIMEEVTHWMPLPEPPKEG